jgi:murein DD-endopeptidase MepM/ murein hydrolase activator NlpD
VRRGQLLGLVGNSGNSDAPHLHFHLMAGPLPLGSNGIPYAIDAFKIEGRVTGGDLSDPYAVLLEPVDNPARRNEMPADWTVVEFPTGGGKPPAAAPG